jgi:hypothetical protein
LGRAIMIKRQIKRHTALFCNSTHTLTVPARCTHKCRSGFNTHTIVKSGFNTHYSIYRAGLIHIIAYIVGLIHTNRTWTSNFPPSTSLPASYVGQKSAAVQCSRVSGINSRKPSTVPPKPMPRGLLWDFVLSHWGAE